MDVVRALGAELWKMFAADLLLSVGALLSVLAVAVALRVGVLPASAAPFVLATLVVSLILTTANLAAAREFRRRSKK